MNYKVLLPLVFVNFVDAISYMVVAPSIVFYVLKLGGTHTQYGLCLSVFSLAAFFGKPFLGFWSDAVASFRIPFIASVIVAILGGFAYFFASACSRPAHAIGLIFIGRLLGGVGAANSALSFAYIAKVMPKQELTRANIALSMTRVLGMSVGPAFNVFLAGIKGSYHFFDGRAIELDPLNSVGLVLVLVNVLILINLLIFLKEPEKTSEDDFKKLSSPPSPTALSFQEKFSCLSRALLSVKILVPVLAIFSMNATFQLIEAGLAPAANHALGWGAVQTSAVLGSTSVVIACGMMVVFALSSRGVSDEVLLLTGLAISTAGYLCLYLFWDDNAHPMQYALPVIFSCFGFPFMAAPNRSLFTAAVERSPALQDKQGFMQAVLGMFASLAGFTAPSFVAVFILREPAVVEASKDHRELSPWGLLAPILPFITLIGVLYAYFLNGDTEKTSSDSHEADPEQSGTISETTGLLSDSTKVQRRRSSVSVQISDHHVQEARRSSIQLMGGICAWDLEKEMEWSDDDDDKDE